jgi:hypothetical protein
MGPFNARRIQIFGWTVHRSRYNEDVAAKTYCYSRSRNAVLSCTTAVCLGSGEIYMSVPSQAIRTSSAKCFEPTVSDRRSITKVRLNKWGQAFILSIVASLLRLTRTTCLSC